MRRLASAQKELWGRLDALRTRNPDRVEAVIQEQNRHALAGYLKHLD